MTDNNNIENAYSLLKGVPFGVYLGQQERTNELDERIFKRNFPSVPLEPNYDPRPISTKYGYFPGLSGRKHIPTNKNEYPVYNVHQVFNPGTSKAPPSGILNDIDNETYLRNQHFALQKGDKQYYVPQSSSELYRDYVYTTDTQMQPHPDLFYKHNFENNRPRYSSLNNIGKDLFNNNTRTQMKQQY